MVDEDFVEDFEEEAALLAHVDANEGWEVRSFSHFLFLRHRIMC